MLPIVNAIEVRVIIFNQTLEAEFGARGYLFESKNIGFSIFCSTHPILHATKKKGVGLLKK